METLIEILHSGNAGSWPPSTFMRWYCAWPIFAFLLALALLSRFGPWLDRLYQDNGLLGALPNVTEFIMAFSDAIRKWPYVLTGVGFLLFWIHLAWCCRTKRRLIITSNIAALAFISAAIFTFMALYEPILRSMEHHGK